MKQKDLIIVGAISAIIIFSVISYRFGDDLWGDSLGSEHVHGIFRVFLTGQAYDFNPNEIAEFHKQDERIFLDDSNWEIHRFSKDATLGVFFNSLGMQFDSTCFILHEPSFCRCQDRYR